MDIEIYSKDPPTFNQLLNKRTKIDRYFYAFVTVIGIVAILLAVWPFMVWQLKTLPRLTSVVKDIPVPESKVLLSPTYAQNVQVIKDADGFSHFTTTYKPKETRPREFYVTIPKLKIVNAVAKVDSLNLNQNLSHFPGSALPGEVGNVFITGHSVLPQFNNPKDYLAIFTKLDDLETGDKVEVKIGGNKYEYLVSYSKIVNPSDVSVLAPFSATGKNLTLMTCVPPGTSLKRLIVVTNLI